MYTVREMSVTNCGILLNILESQDYPYGTGVDKI